MAGIINTTKKFSKHGTLTIDTYDYQALKPATFALLKYARLARNGVFNAIDASWALDTSTNAIRKRVSELREHGFTVITERNPSYNSENLYYVRD